MKRIKKWCKAFVAIPYMKYIIVFILGGVVIGFVDSNSSVRAHLSYKQRISELQDEIEFYENENARDQERIRQLETNPTAMERIAREHYFMKHADEDIFVLSEDMLNVNLKSPADETYE